MLTTHLGADDGVVDAVVADLDGDLPVGQVRSDEWGLNFDMGLFPRVQHVPAEKALSLWLLDIQ